MALQVGSLVKLEGLVSAAQYNGLVAIVVEDKNTGTGRWGVQLLDHAAGWLNDKKKKCGGKQMAAKEANLVLTARDSDVWRNSQIGGGGGFSVWEFILRSPDLANEEYCDKFCMKLWNCFFETVPAMPLTIDHGLNWRHELLSATGHKIFWLSLEAVQHYLIIEKTGGRYRVFQSYVKVLTTTGYTAGQWCTLDSMPSNRTHKKYGGGLTLGDTEINEFLDAIVDFQKVTKALIRPLLEYNPVVDSSSIDLLNRGNPTSLSPSEMEQAGQALNALINWSHQVILKVGPLGITTLDETSDPVVVYQANQLLFKIPQKLYRQVELLNEKLTGEAHYLSPVIFVNMINQGIWWEHQQSPSDGGGTGFTVRGAAFDSTLSYEEGLAVAEENRAKFRQQMGR
jgi:hypothetical protein